MSTAIRTFKQPKSINIKIIDNVAMIDMPSKEGFESHKTVKLQSLISAFQKYGMGTETPILPPNTLKYKERGNNATLILAHPPAKFTAQVNRYNTPVETFENCIRPAVIMVYELYINTDGSFSLNNTRAYGIREEFVLINNNTRLYYLPFPNIGDGGWVCWGSNKVSGSFKSLIAFGTFVDRLFTSPFNSDLFRSSILSEQGINNPSDLFTYLQDKDIFPESLLMAVTNSDGRNNIGGL